MLLGFAVVLCPLWLCLVLAGAAWLCRAGYGWRYLAVPGSAWLCVALLGSAWRVSLALPGFALSGDSFVVASASFVQGDNTE